MTKAFVVADKHVVGRDEFNMNQYAVRYYAYIVQDGKLQTIARDDEDDAMRFETFEGAEAVVDTFNEAAPEEALRYHWDYETHCWVVTEWQSGESRGYNGRDYYTGD